MQGINFIGDITGDSGVCEGARLTLQAIQQQQIPVSYVQKFYNIPRQIEMVSKYRNLKTGNRHPVNLLYYNQIDVAHEKDELIRLTDNKYTVSYWVWEIMILPEPALPAFDLVDEIWTASHFCKDIYQRYTDKPIHVIPHPIQMPNSISPNREQFGIPQDRMVFMSSFNVSSVFARKNPLAIIDAFQKAFDGLSPAHTPVLVLKTQELENYPLVKQVLVNRMKEIGGILINGSLSRQNMYSLLSSCDVYISLHRSEGFGLGMAEAMYLGKPVIATAYSGNMDYMTDENSCLVDYHMRQILPDDHRYSPKDTRIFPPDGQWANPDVDHASYYMQQLYADPSLRQAMGQSAAESIRKYCSFGQVGQRITRRIQQLDRHDLKKAVNNRKIISATASYGQPDVHPAVQLDESPSTMPHELNISYTYNGLFQSKYTKWQAIRVKGDLRSKENLILHRIPLIGFLYRTWYRIRHLGTFLAIQTQLIDLLSAQHHEHSAFIQQLSEQNREYGAFMQQLSDQNRELKSLIDQTIERHKSYESQISRVSSQLHDLKTEVRQQYLSASEEVAFEISRWKFLHEQAVEDVQENVQIENNRLGEMLHRLKDRQHATKNTLFERIDSIEQQMNKNDQSSIEHIREQISQTDERLRILTSRQRMIEHQASLIGRQSQFAGLLNIVSAIETLFEEIASAETVDVSIGGIPHPDDLQQLFDYWGDRIQIVAPKVQYHFDFTTQWNRVSVFENASNKISRNGLFALITYPQHSRLPIISSLEMISSEQLVVSDKLYQVYIFRNLRKEDIYGN
jgi:glycosyltransferase involved in cell wall biosynthesis